MDDAPRELSEPLVGRWLHRGEHWMVGEDEWPVAASGPLEDGGRMISKESLLAHDAIRSAGCVRIAAIPRGCRPCFACLHHGDGDHSGDLDPSRFPSWLPTTWLVVAEPRRGEVHLPIGTELHLRDTDHSVYVSHGESVGSDAMTVRFLMTVGTGVLAANQVLIVETTVTASEMRGGVAPYPIASFLEPVDKAAE